MNSITIKVSGQFVSKSSKNAGAAGNGNECSLKFVFDESWRGYAKRVLWRDSKGENLTSVILEPDFENQLIYTSGVPYIIMKSPGWCTFTVEGYYNSAPEKVNKSVNDSLFVSYSEVSDEITPPTPNEVMQLQNEFESLIPKVKRLIEETRSEVSVLCANWSQWEEYDDTKIYQKGNKVFFGGCSYVCLKEASGVSPQNSGYWLMIASRGERGQKGNQGPQGIEGERGIQGHPGEKGDKGEKGEKGDNGERGLNGSIVPSNGFYTFSVDENGDLWIHYPDAANIPDVALNSDGELILTVDKDNNSFNVGKVTGEKGYTPVKGTDYFTQEDKNEIINAVLAALPDGDEVEY